MFVMIEKITSDDGWTPPYPEQATVGSAGYDLVSASRDAIVIPPGHRAIIPTGIKIGLGLGVEAQIRSRSGLAAKKGVIVLNSPGTIDPDYRGEIGVILMNFGNEMFPVNRGDRIAQMIISRYERVRFADGILNDTARGSGGFGSTGTKGFDVT